MDRARLDSWCERGILGLVLAILVFGPLATGAARPQDLLVIQALTLGVMLLWGLRFWIHPPHRLLWPPVCWGVVLFVGYAIGRYLTADIEYYARQEMIRVLIYASLFFAILNNLHRQESTQIIALTLLGLGTLISFYAVYQFLADSDRVWTFVRPALYRHRGSGTYICPNHLAGFLEMLLPLAVTYTLTGRFSYLTKVLLSYASLAILVGIVVSVSRGGWIATTFSLILLSGWLVKQRDFRMQSVILLGVLATAAVLLVLVVQRYPKRFKGMVSAGQVTDIRFQLWGPALKMWQDHLWWGAGPAHFNARFPQYRPVNWEVQNVRPDRVHNDYLNTLADWGLAGAVLVSGAWGLFYWGVFRSWRHVQRAPNDLATKRTNKSAFVLGASLGLVAILIHSFVDYNMHVPANAILAVSLMALVTGYFRFASESYWISLRGPLKWLASLILAGGICYLGRQLWQGGNEQRWLGRAEAIARKEIYSAEHLGALKKAYAIECMNPDTAYGVGETLYMQSSQGKAGYEDLAKDAMKWLERSMAMNPYWPNSYFRYGMCLDWIGRHAEAEAYFQRAADYDPYSFLTAAHLGWHYFQVEDYERARLWFEKSRRLSWNDNPMAYSYLRLVDEKLKHRTGLK